MSESETIPFWGPEQLELFHLMAQAIDPEGRIPGGRTPLVARHW